MAKRFNIIRNIKDEIEKGNIYLDTNGNFVSEEMLERRILDDFKRAITNGDKVALGQSLPDYKKAHLEKFVKAEKVIECLDNAFPFLLVSDITNEIKENAEPSATRSLESYLVEQKRKGGKQNDDIKRSSRKATTVKENSDATN